MYQVKFNNPWMKLWVCSMGKLLHVSHAAPKSEEIRPYQLREKNIVTFSQLCGVQLLGDPYQPCIRLPQVTPGISDTPFLPAYIESTGKFFRLALIAHSDEEANQFMEKYPGTAVIATDPKHRVYIASLEESKGIKVT